MSVLRFHEVLIFFIIISSLWTIITASPVRKSNICGPAHCKYHEAGSKKFYYKSGNVYFYQYVINGTSSIEGGPAEQSGLHLSSKVTIKFLSACDAILFISDVDVWQSHLLSGSENHIYTKPTTRIGFRKSLEEFPLRFSYADGRIEEICPDAEESIWALNIKKGLLSAFQNTMRRLDLEHKAEEDDVHGRCKVEYKLGTATSSALTVERIKDISSCGDKFGILSSIQGTPYSFGTLHQSMPAVSSTSECEQIVDRNLVSGVRCSESHKLTSLARGAAGAYTNILQKLDLISVYEPIIPRNETKESGGGMDMDNEDSEESGEDAEGKESLTEVIPMTESGDGLFYISHQLDPSVADVISKAPENITKRDSLLFQHDYHLSQTTNDYNTAKIALTNFCLALKSEVQQSSGEHFEALMSVLRGLSLQDMTNLAKDAADICQGDRTPFDDALEAVGTGASVGVIREQILKGDAPVATIGSWIDSLTYIPKPDLSLVQAATEILRKRDSFPNILLSYSALAHSFCKTHPQCNRHQPISILSKLYDRYFNATNCSTKKRKEVDQVLMYLKGIGNFGLYTPAIGQALHTCINKNERNEIRVAAIEAYRRMPCDTDITILKHLYQNQLEDSEVRITAFLGLMKCPSYPTIRLIKRQLEAEKINQVGSFVWTYLKNLQETALPSKVELQGLLADEILTKKFAVDIRKFSRNMEISSFYDDYNLGVGMDGNLIFSQNSYLPRSAMLNLTVDLFGESINVFEATIRMESFEHYVESIFGPNGKLKNSELYNIVSSLREKRAVPSKRKLRTLALEYDAMKRYYRDPIVSFSWKTFGNEVMFKRKVGVEEQTDFVASLDPFRYLESLANKDTNWQKSAMLLDSSYIIPTGVGFPLNLSAQASSIMRFQATSMMDTASFRANPSELKLKGKLQPSALLTVVGSMTLSAFEIHTGIKVRANVRSSTAVEASFHMKGTQLMTAEFGLPKTKLELLDYRSDVMFMQGDEFRVVGDHPRPNPVCTAGVFHKYLGLKLCGSSHFSITPRKSSAESWPATEEEDGQSLAPYFPLNGPAHLTLTLDKADSTLIKTKVNYIWNNDEKRTKLSATYETTRSSSQQNKTSSSQIFGLTLDVDKINQEAHFTTILPSHSVEASAQLSKDSSNGRLQITAKSSHHQILSSLISFEKKTKQDGKASINPTMSLTWKSQKILDAKGEISIVEKGSRGKAKAFKGAGEMMVYGKDVKIGVEGSTNDTGLAFVWDGEYQTSSSNTETIRWKTAISKRELKEEQSSKLRGDTRQIDMTLSLDFSEFPEYNLGASWKYQRNEEGFENEAELRQGKGPSWSDRNALKIRHSAVHLRNHEGSRMKWMFLVTEPARHTDWGFEASFNSQGKSLDSAINLRYAPGKNLQTSLSLKRAPGVLTFVQIGWNITLPNLQPLHISVHLEEKAHRLYQGIFHTDWFGVDNITVGVDYYDKSKRHRLDRSVQFSLETKTFDLLKLGSHVISDDKDSKLILSSEYKEEKKTLQMGYSHLSRGKHKVYANLTSGENVYLLSSEIELLHGFQCVIKTDLAAKFPDIYARLTATNQNGMQLFGLEYDWDASRDKSKQFLLEFFMDLSRDYIRRAELVLAYPGRYFLIGGDYTKNKEESSRVVTGRLKWDEQKHLHVNARLVPRISEHEAYDFLLQLVTPFEVVKNASFTVGLDFRSENDCHILIDGSWGDKNVLSGVIESQLEELESEGDGREDVAEVEDETPARLSDGEEEYEDDDTDNDSERDDGPVIAVRTTATTTKKHKYKSHKFTLNANMSSSVPDWNLLAVKISHTQHGPLNVKTDIDIQLPNEKEISVASHWVLPDRLKDILSTRAEMHIKTPFIGYQNIDFQAILGQQEDSDVLAIAGIYIENFQYAVTITGTPRFEEDGALGFDITTSNAKYDKIFGSFSYATGDSSRLACQLGWPQVVIGLEAGFEWNGWEEFQLYSTFTSPWMPLRNINALAKIDSTQAEFKAEFNEDGINAKSEWAIESWESFDVRLDGSTPFEKYQKFGLVLKNSFDDEVAYHSQIVGWINDKQAGYELTGGTSEVEEAEVVAVIRNVQLEIDTVVYPKIRTTFNLAQRDAVFNVTASLLLREGPINVGVELDLLDVFRFNEKITITTPYPGLFELEINLTPAIMPESEVYNVGLHSKWRSGSKWQEGGLVIRYGPQKKLIAVLTTEAEEKAADRAALEAYDEADEGVEEDAGPKIKLDVPGSQLFHFYSPLSWAQELKWEFESVDGSGEDEEAEGAEDEEDEDGAADQFPIRSFVLVYRGDDAELSTSLENKKLTKSWSASVDLPRLEKRVSVKLNGALDLSELEKSFVIEAISLYPESQTISGTVSWMLTLPSLLEASVEVKTPLENLEEQSLKLTYAHNEDDLAYSFDFELNSLTYEKYATVIAYSPRSFSMTVDTPIQGIQEVELRAEISPKDDDPDIYNTLITINSDKRDLEIELDSIMVDDWPTQIEGTVKASFGPSAFRNGAVKVNVEKTGDVVNATGGIDFSRNQKLTVKIILKIPQQTFREMDLKVDTPFKNYEKWQLWILHPPSQRDDQFDFKLKAETPYQPLASIQAEGFLQMDSSFLDVKKATVSCNASSGIANITTSWHLSEWNNFDVFSDIKYTLYNENSSTFDNSFKFKAKNKIPTLSTLTSIDSKLLLDSKQPPIRFGGIVFVEAVEDESLTSKISLKLPSASYAAEYKSKFDEDLNKIDAKLQYNCCPLGQNYQSTLKLTRGESSLEGEAQVEWGKGEFSPLQSRFNCSFAEEDESAGVLHLQVLNPQTPNRQLAHLPLLTIDGTFNKIFGRHTARIQAGQVLNPVVIDVDVSAENMYDIDSTVNVSSSFIEDIPESSLRLMNKIDGNYYSGLYGGHWGEQKASLNYTLDYKETSDLMRINATVGVEMPFPTANSAGVQGFYAHEAMNTESKFRVEFNGVQLVNSDYGFKSISSAGKEKEQTKLELDNHFWPFGLTNLYLYEYSGGYDGLNLPTTTVRAMEVYDLLQPDLHKLGGELKIQTNFTGREIALTGTHPRRKLQLITNYDFLDHQFRHNARFTWKADSWIGYELDVMNMTNKERMEKRGSLRVHYPLRVIQLNSDYIYQERSLKWTTELNLNASKSDRKLVSVVRWDETSSGATTLHKSSLTLKHPALPQEMRATGELKTVKKEVGRGRHFVDVMIPEWIEGQVTLDYANDAKRRVTLLMKTIPGLLGEKTNEWKYWNLTADLRLQHSATNLDLKTLHSSRHSAHELSIITLIDFKNSQELPQKSKIAFELFKELRKLHIMVSSPDDFLVVNGHLTGRYPDYMAVAEANVTGVFPLPKASMTMNVEKPYLKMYAIHGRDLTDGYFMEGGVVDSRNVKFDISRSYDNFRFSDVNFFLRMNHSRLITSRLKWRPELFQEIKESSVKMAGDLSHGWSQQSDKLLLAVSTDASQVAHQIWEDAKSSIEPFIQEMRDECDFRNDSQAFRTFFQDIYERNEFYSQDMAGFAQLFAEEVTAQLTPIFSRLNETRLESSQILEQTILWIYDKATESYNNFVGMWKEGTSSSQYFSKFVEQLSLLMYKGVGACVKLSEEIFNSLSTYSLFVISYLDEIIEKYKPTIYGFFHRVEAFLYRIIVQASDYFYEARDEVMRSAYYQKLAKLAADVDQIYRDLAMNDAATNIRKYYTMVKNFILKKIGENGAYEIDLGRVGEVLSGWWREFKELGAVQEVKEWWISLKAKMTWLADYTQLDESVREIIVALYTKGEDLLYQTVLQASSRYQQAKTRFIFDSDKGIISLEQKLPMPWNAFNETPVFRELPEYQNILKIQEFLRSSDGSFWDVYYKVMPDSNLLNWLPPFDGQAMLVGPEYFFTFDGLAYNFTGSGAYLLAGDMVDSNFSVTVQYQTKTSHKIVVSAGHNTLIIDFDANGLRDPKKPTVATVNLPVQMQHLQGYRDGSKLVVENNKGMSVSCNMAYRICGLWVSGWYSRKAAGLFGTMDEEPTSDMILSNGKRTENITAMIKSWDVSDDNSDNRDSITRKSSKTHSVEAKVATTCSKLFHTTLSSMQPCFSTVKVDPYSEICISSSNLSSSAICTAAMAYVSMCKTKGVIVNVPSTCIKCDMNGEEMMDRDVKVIDSNAGSPVIQSTDVVFILELKDCNKNFKVKRSVDVLIKTLAEELSKANFKQNRYAVVVFGGDGVYSKPRAVFHNNQVFTDADGLSQYLSSLPTGNGSRDTFGAISYTLEQLDFRPGVSKTFILFPCSSCQPQHMTMDFSDIHHDMLEQDATLHILMNNDFSFDNKTLAKKFFGLDNNFAYTKRDGEKQVLRGDVNIRRQVKLSRSVLGYCTPLAFQSNGTVFSGKKLQNKREHIVKLFTGVFSQRVVQTAKPASCHTCYCSSTNQGVGTIQCFLCGFPRNKAMPQTDDSEDIEEEETGTEVHELEDEVEYDDTEREEEEDDERR